MKSKPGTIAALLKQAATDLQPVCETPRLDAEVLLAYCLERDRSYLFTWPEKTLPEQQTTQFKQLIARRAEHVPLAHLTGTREFWSLEFNVTPDTLIPRADTELLVELSLDLLGTAPGPVLDLGTGSGVIAISIAHEMPDIRVDAVDFSTGALAIAKDNARQNKTHVNFVLSSWYTNVRHSDYRLIVSNPPYLAADDSHLGRDGLQFEPRSALVADDNGLEDIRTIIAHASEFSCDNAAILIEHGYTQGADVRALMHAQGFQQVTTHTDIESRERVTLAAISK